MPLQKTFFDSLNTALHLTRSALLRVQVNATVRHNAVRTHQSIIKRRLDHAWY